MTHKLKLERAFWDAVASNEKNFEIRFNDRGFQRGDKLELRCWSQEHHCYTEPYAPIIREITYVLSGYGLKEGWVALGIKEVPND